MINNTDYVKLSLELNLFFARIMKEHSFFLEIGFMNIDENFKRKAREFQREFEKILNDVVDLSNNRISNEILMSGEIVTNNTLEAENKSSKLTGVRINEEITEKELRLQSGMIYADERLVRKINEINNNALFSAKHLIDFKQEILNNVLSCKMFTGNYPLLIEHIMNEAKMYLDLLSKLQKKEEITDDFVCKQEIFWDTIMQQHAEFIRGLLDPSEQALINQANQFANEYKKIISNGCSYNLTNTSLQETIKFRDFKVAGENGILNCQIKSIIVPLLADHVLREANHFIRLLKKFAKKNYDGRFYNE